MTVKELINRLKQEPPDAMVVVYNEDYFEPEIHTIPQMGEYPEGHMDEYDSDPQLGMKLLGPAVFIG